MSTETNSPSSVADQLASILHSQGVTIAYGLPGGASLPLLNAFRKQGIRFVLVRNESSAVYMADVTARLTGVVGVCVVTLGPGATNAYAGVSHAYLDRSPVLIITADFPREAKIGHTHQVLDLKSIFEPVTKLSADIGSTHSAEELYHALDVCQSGRPGPVHLTLDGQSGDLEHSPWFEPYPNVPPIAPIPETEREKAHKTLAQASRPVIVAGLGLEPHAPYTELQQLADMLQAPVIDTPKSKGCFPNSHPLFVGTIGLTKSDPAYQILDESDCIIAVGLDVVELVRRWRMPQPLIWVAAWPNVDPVLPAASELVGQMGDILTELQGADILPDKAWGFTRVGQYRDAQASLPQIKPSDGRMSPQEVLTAVRANVPADTFVSTDVGSHKILTALQWQSDVPNRYMVSNGVSAMGFGLPAAIAAALVLDEPVVCIHGDGGFQMVMGELGLMTQYELPVICIILNDAALDLIRTKQQRRNEPIFGTEFTNPDYADIARGYNIPYFKVADYAACAAAVRTAVESCRPAIIDAQIDPVCYPTSAVQTTQL